MIIESLIRLGRPYVEGGQSADEVIRQISSIEDPTARNFWQHVFVIEADRTQSSTRIASHPMYAFGDFKTEGRKEVFAPDPGRTVSAPWMLPSGGNPLQPQGNYAVPVYPVYEKQWVKFASTDGGEAIRAFLRGRLQRTSGLRLDECEMEEIVRLLNASFAAARTSDSARQLGIVVLAVVEEDGFYHYSAQADQIWLARSAIRPDLWISPNLERIVDALWRAKADEGAEYGSRDGDYATCSVCGAAGEVVSSYSKSWPWLVATWTGPVSNELRRRGAKPQLVEGIALCSRCYGALTYGSKVFYRLKRDMPTWLTKEIFSPIDSAEGRRTRSRGSSPATISGSAFVLPVLQDVAADDYARERFTSNIDYMCQARTGRPHELHLRTLTGLEQVLPDELNDDLYRLDIFYYTVGQASSPTLRAVIEDVVPSVASTINDELDELRTVIAPLTRRLGLNTRGNDDFLRDRLTSLPSLLSRAYGSTYLWQTLSEVLHRQPLSLSRFVRASAYRMAELSHRLPDSSFDMRHEVLFFLVFREFVRRYNTDVAGKGEEAVRSWQELQEVLEDQPPDRLELETVEELGFAAGYLVRQFARQYWAATKVGREGKDFLKHRVMSFGSSLTPDLIAYKAISQFEEYAMRVNAHLPNALRQRAGIWLSSYLAMRGQVQRSRDSFMAAFWSGYWLNGAQTQPAEDSQPAAV